MEVCESAIQIKNSFCQSHRHTGKNLLSCTICNMTFGKLSHLKAHTKAHERERRAGGTFECHLCRFQFLAVHGLRMHMNLIHVSGIKNAFQCKHCNEVLTKQIGLDDHLRSVCICRFLTFFFLLLFEAKIF